jgi:hypothetical protein
VLAPSSKATSEFIATRFEARTRQKAPVRGGFGLLSALNPRQLAKFRKMARMHFEKLVSRAAYQGAAPPKGSMIARRRWTSYRGPQIPQLRFCLHELCRGSRERTAPVIIISHFGRRIHGLTRAGETVNLSIAGAHRTGAA